MEKNIPKRRFKEFIGSGEWKEKKLGEVVQITMGQSPSSNNYTENPNDYILVQGNADMKKGKVHPRVWTTQITKQANKNDLILSVRAPVGDIGKTDYDVVLGRGVAGITGNEFIFQFLNKIKDEGYWKTLSTGSTFQSINSNDIKNAFILIPSLEEQEKIGKFFEKLDRLIDLNGEKLEKLKNIKSAYLSEMFPKEGELYPKRRFTGFTEPWEEKKLGDITDVRDGTHDSPKFISIGYPLITSKNLKNGYINFDEVQYISRKDYNNINKRSRVDKNDILMGMIGTIGNIALVSQSPNFAIKNVALIKNINKINYLYLYYNMQSSAIKLQLFEGIDGGTQKFIALNKIRNLNIVFPSLQEQEKIGNFFKKLDERIILQEEKIEKLENMKKAYLSEMFV